MAIESELRCWAAVIVSASALGIGCDGSAEENDDGSFGNPPGNGIGGQMGSPGPDLPSAGAGGRPPEQENENRYLAPVATGKYLWTANPLSGRVALIDATTLQVRLETAGNGPTDVIGLPDTGDGLGALVLNQQSDDATLFRLDAAGRPTKHAPLRTHADANAWARSPSGRWAIAWTDAGRLARAPDPLETLQDVTLFSLERGDERAEPLSVGTRPSAFAFSADERHAYAVTEEGISVIELGETPEVAGSIPLVDDPLDTPAARDVSFSLTDEASFAVVRAEGSRELGIVTLPEGTRQSVTFDSAVTDVDLAPGGDRAFVVLGLLGDVLSLPVPPPSSDGSSYPRVHPGARQIGAIALNTDATAAVVYSTVLGATRVSLLDTSGDELAAGRAYDLISPLEAVFPAPDPRFAVAFQRPAPNSQKAGAFSLLSLTAPRVPKIVATDALPVQIAFAPDSDAALIAVRSDARSAFGAYVVRLASQQVDLVELASPPLAVGIVPSARRAYVAQQHPEGRITLISLDDASVQTLTGFELSARIVSE